MLASRAGIASKCHQLKELCCRREGQHQGPVGLKCQEIGACDAVEEESQCRPQDGQGMWLQEATTHQKA